MNTERLRKANEKLREQSNVDSVFGQHKYVNMWWYSSTDSPAVIMSTSPPENAYNSFRCEFCDVGGYTHKCSNVYAVHRQAYIMWDLKHHFQPCTQEFMVSMYRKFLEQDKHTAELDRQVEEYEKEQQQLE